MRLTKTTAFILALALSLMSLFACGDEPPEPQGTPPAQEQDGTQSETVSAPDFCIYKTERSTEGRDISTVKISVRDYGTITLLLDGTTAPITVANFKRLVSEGFYDGLTFHRIIDGFMIQGGCPNGDGTGNADETIKGEFSSNGHENDISHLRGVISMARGDAKNSASCQFFICSADTTALDGNYATFGYVTEGMSVVDKITDACAKYATDGDGGIEYKVLQPVIEKIEII